MIVRQPELADELHAGPAPAPMCLLAEHGIPVRLGPTMLSPLLFGLTLVSLIGTGLYVLAQNPRRLTHRLLAAAAGFLVLATVAEHELLPEVALPGEAGWLAAQAVLIGASLYCLLLFATLWPEGRRICTRYAWTGGLALSALVAYLLVPGRPPLVSGDALSGPFVLVRNLSLLVLSGAIIRRLQWAARLTGTKQARVQAAYLTGAVLIRWVGYGAALALAETGFAAEAAAFNTTVAPLVSALLIGYALVWRRHLDMRGVIEQRALSWALGVGQLGLSVAFVAGLLHLAMPTGLPTRGVPGAALVMLVGVIALDRGRRWSLRRLERQLDTTLGRYRRAAAQFGTHAVSTLSRDRLAELVRDTVGPLAPGRVHLLLRPTATAERFEPVGSDGPTLTVEDARRLGLGPDGRIVEQPIQHGYHIFAPVCVRDGLAGAILIADYPTRLPDPDRLRAVADATGLALENISLYDGLVSANDRLHRTIEALETADRVGRSQQTLRDGILHSVEVGVIVLDPQQGIIEWNRTMNRFAGRERDDVIGQPLSEALPEALWTAGFAEIARALAEGQPAVRRVFAYTLGDDETHLHVAASPLVGADGEAGGTVIILADLTDRVRLETQLRQADRMAAVGGLAAALAHEIRNPLGSILTGVTLIGGPNGLDESDRALIHGTIQKESKRLNETLNDFLQFARPREPRRQPTPIGALLGGIVAMIEGNSALRGEVRFTLDTPTDLVATVDADQLRQIVWNTVLNGVQAMNGHGTLSISARLTSAEGSLAAGVVGGRALALRVHDTGPGIPAEVLPRLFEPFVTSKREGTGLGLAIVRRIIEANDGTVAVDSSPAGGTAFTFTLPTVAQD